MNTMRVLSVLLVAAFVYIATPKHVFAFSPPTIQVGIVQGLISGSDNNAVDGATVTITCNGTIQNTVSNGTGFYAVQFPTGVCTTGMQATVTAAKNGQSGQAVGIMQDGGTIGFLRLDLAVIHVPIVPEFGLVTGMIALLSSAGSYAIFKKRS